MHIGQKLVRGCLFCLWYAFKTNLLSTLFFYLFFNVRTLAAADIDEEEGWWIVELDAAPTDKLKLTIKRLTWNHNITLAVTVSLQCLLVNTTYIAFDIKSQWKRSLDLVSQDLWKAQTEAYCKLNTTYYRLFRGGLLNPSVRSSPAYSENLRIPMAASSLL